MSIDIERLKELEAKATSAPWEVKRRGPFSEILALDDFAVATVGRKQGGDAEAAFIVELRNAFPALLREREGLMRIKEAAEAYMQAKSGLRSVREALSAFEKGE